MKKLHKYLFFSVLLANISLASAAVEQSLLISIINDTPYDFRYCDFNSTVASVKYTNKKIPAGQSGAFLISLPESTTLGGDLEFVYGQQENSVGISILDPTQLYDGTHDYALINSYGSHFNLQIINISRNPEKNPKYLLDNSLTVLLT